MTTTAGHVDVAGIRAAFPIAQVVQESGVALRPSGHGFVGCCPFHDDSTPSLSVGGVPNRFTCFGCGAHGDVIDYIQQLHGLSFVDAVRSLTTADVAVTAVPAIGRPGIPSRSPAPTAAVSPSRGFEINALAWERFSTPVAVGFADSYLRFHRGIDLRALRAENPHAPFAGHAGHGWTSLTEHLRREGVDDDEVLAMDLARTTRAGRLVDALRDRLILPVTDSQGRIAGFIGRDLSEDPRAPKYLNPTRTATFDKSAFVHRPTHHDLSPAAHVIVVEGPLDALAITAAAARAGRSADFAPCTTSGLAVSPVQAAEVVMLANGRPPILALDGDDAGTEGTRRWLSRICVDQRTPALVTRLPAGMDPADWIRDRGIAGLSAFDPSQARARDRSVGVSAPGRELVQTLLARGGDPIDRIAGVIDVLLPLAEALPRARAGELLDQAVREMTRQGWNPDQRFSRALSRALDPSIGIVPASEVNAFVCPRVDARARTASLPQL